MNTFIYIGKYPANIFYGGISFPVFPGCIIRGNKDFLDKYISPRKLKKYTLKEGDEVKYTFKTRSMVLEKDPMGGLPMRSVIGRAPLLNKAPKPEETGETVYEKLYDIREKENLVESTAVDEKLQKEIEDREKKLAETSAVEEPVTEPATEELDEELAASADEDTEEYDATGIPSPPEGVITPRKHKEMVSDEELEAALEDTPALEDIPVEDMEFDSNPPREGAAWVRPDKTSLRQERKDELLYRAFAIRDEGAPLNPELLSAFEAIDNSTTKGPIFELIFKYYGFN